MSTTQTRPVYLTARSGSSLSSVSSFISGHSPFANLKVSFDSNLVPSNSDLLHTESGVVENLSLGQWYSLSSHKWIGADLQGLVPLI